MLLKQIWVLVFSIRIWYLAYKSLNLNISNNLNLHLENLHFENSGKFFVLPQKEIMIFNLVRKSQQLMLICQELGGFQLLDMIIRELKSHMIC